MIYLPEKKTFDHSLRPGLPGDFQGRDFLTEVYSKAGFEPYLKELLRESRRKKKIFSIVFMDLDRFKKCNDKCGHLFGDEILKYVGSSLRLTFHDVRCKIFRYGGDEFVIVFPEKTPRETLRLVQLLKYNMKRRPILFKGRFFRITASYGIAGYPNDATQFKALVKKADMAQYTSKSQGRNLVTLASQIRSRRFYKTLMLISISVIYIMLFLSLQPVFKNLAETAVDFFGPRTAAENVNLDTIILKDGRVLQGKIRQETYQSLTLDYRLRDRTVSLYFDKVNVEKKLYGLKTGSRERFDAYIRVHPNPHKK